MGQERNIQQWGESSVSILNTKRVERCLKVKSCTSLGYLDFFVGPGKGRLRSPSFNWQFFFQEFGSYITISKHGLNENANLLILYELHCSSPVSVRQHGKLTLMSPLSGIEKIWKPQISIVYYEYLWLFFARENLDLLFLKTWLFFVWFFFFSVLFNCFLQWWRISWKSHQVDTRSSSS